MPSDDNRHRSPFEVRNVRLFIVFRLFFNSRFYYPVFSILFLDFGLTLSQFALLNVAWAITIVLLEVPSGALADTIGRRNLLVTAGVLMVGEMLLLCFAPRGNMNLLFAFFLVNRILSGTAEAAASGADEALAYDALQAEGDIRQWGRVLEMQMRFQSIGFILAMSVGAAVYDPSLMQQVASALGIAFPITQALTLRFPLYLTLVMAIVTLITTLRMQETNDRASRSGVPAASQPTTRQAFAVTLRAGGWIMRTPFALILILGGLLFDSVSRMLVTVGSQYYRLIDLPEASFGLIGSGMAMIGLFIPRIARHLTQRHSPRFNLGLMTLCMLAALGGMTLFVPIAGLIPMLLISSLMYFNGFFMSHYLNRITSSEQRATVLSFKGLSFNLAYGVIGMLYALLLAGLRGRIGAAQAGIGETALKNSVFIEAMAWFPGYFIVLLLALLWFAHIRLRTTVDHKRVG
jgi:MFS family permease